MTDIYLSRKRKNRLEQGHPWVFKNEVEQIEGRAEPGELVNVYDAQKRFLATGFVNLDSQICVRIVSFEKLEQMDTSFFVERFQQCCELRERFIEEQTDSYRMVYGEADFLPGLVVDKYADVYVVQILSLGMEQHREALIEALVQIFKPRGIYERSDASVRRLEGLEPTKGELYGECPQFIKIEENGILMEVDIIDGQKTGYFFDQRENRASINRLMTGWGKKSGIQLSMQNIEGAEKLVPVNRNGKVVTFPYWDGATVLECFAHTGSFTMHACKYGAKKATCLDISAHAIETAKRNAELNGFSDRVEFVVEDAFHYLRRQAKALNERQERSMAGKSGKIDTSTPLELQGQTWDVVILDPPAFAKTRNAVSGAVRGYKDINLHGLKLVNEGGFLVTASCSSHITPDVFLQTIHQAAIDAGKILRLIEFRGAGKDHPQILGVDEGNYLKFAIFEVRSR